MFAFTLLTERAWRRALGFGYLDPGSGLTVGNAYDYRITAHVYRRDREETLLGFHTVPRDTTLPSSFHIGRVLFTLPSPRQVILYPSVPGAALRAIGRKGLSIASPAPGADSLVISFGTPVLRVVLELEPAATGGLSYEARPTSFFTGLGQTPMTGTITPTGRVTLDFTEPADTLALRGTALLYGIRLPDPTANPDDLLDVTAIVPGAL